MSWKASTENSVMYNLTNDIAEANRILLFDTHNLVHKCIKAKHFKTLSLNGIPTGHLHGLLQQVCSAIKSYTSSNDKTALVFTVEAESERKKRLFSAYKANRDKKSEENISMAELLKMNTTLEALSEALRICVEDKRDTEKIQIEMAYRVLRLLPTVWIEKAGEEADDVIASFCEKNLNKNITVLSSDKDLWQLLNIPSISIYSSVHKGFIGDALLEKNFSIDKCHAFLIPLIKALYGDSSDNIPQVPFNLSRDMILNYAKMSDGTVQSFISNIVAHPPLEDDIREKLFAALNKYKGQLLNFWHITYLVRNLDYTQSAFSANKEELISILKKYQLNQALVWTREII